MAQEICLPLFTLFHSSRLGRNFDAQRLTWSCTESGLAASRVTDLYTMQQTSAEAALHAWNSEVGGIRVCGSTRAA